MTVTYTESEAIDNARANLNWWGVAPALLATADKARLIELLKQKQKRVIEFATPDAPGLAYAITVALIRDLERPCP